MTPRLENCRKFSAISYIICYSIIRRHGNHSCFKSNLKVHTFIKPKIVRLTMKIYSPTSLKDQHNSRKTPIVLVDVFTVCGTTNGAKGKTYLWSRQLKTVPWRNMLALSMKPNSTDDEVKKSGDTLLLKTSHLQFFSEDQEINHMPYEDNIFLFYIFI